VYGVIRGGGVMSNATLALPAPAPNPFRSWRFYFVPVWFAIWTLVYTAMGIPKVALEIIVVLALYFVLSTPVRAVPGWLLVLMFGIGNVIVPWVTVFLQVVLRSLGPKEEYFLGGVIAPVTEELMKIFPVVVLYFWPRPRVRNAFGAIDWMLLGAASGAGSQLWEDVLIRWQYSFPSRAPNIFGMPLISGFTDNGLAVFPGHTTTAAFIALALGWARYIKMLTPRPLPGAPKAWAAFRASRAFAYTPAIIILMWMIVDHAGNNLRNADAWYWKIANGIYFLGGRGRFSCYAFLIASAATLIFEMIMLRRARKPRFESLEGASPFESLRRRWRRLIRAHQMRYVQMATGIRDRLPLSAEMKRSEPGWNLISFLRRSFMKA
jgi:RsiW-degrading membrane proteinase PrsW (M82 family)